MASEQVAEHEERMARLMMKLDAMDKATRPQQGEYTSSLWKQLMHCEATQEQADTVNRIAIETIGDKLTELKSRMLGEDQVRNRREQSILSRLSTAQHRIRLLMNQQVREVAEQQGTHQKKIEAILEAHEEELKKMTSQRKELEDELADQQQQISTLSQQLTAHEHLQQSSEENAYTRFADRLTHLKAKFELNCKHRKETQSTLAEHFRASQQRVLQAIAKQKRQREQNEALALSILEHTIERIQSLS